MALGKAVAFANLGKRLPPPTVEVPSASPRSKLALYLQEETEDFCHLFLFFFFLVRWVIAWLESSLLDMAHLKTMRIFIQWSTTVNAYAYRFSERFTTTPWWLSSHSLIRSKSVLSSRTRSYCTWGFRSLQRLWLKRPYWELDVTRVLKQVRNWLFSPILFSMTMS